MVDNKVSLRIRLSRVLTSISVVRFRNTPTRRNTIHAIGFIVLAFPVAAVVFFAFVVQGIFREKRQILILAVDGEFAPFIAHMESLRCDLHIRRKFDFVLILSKWRHPTLDGLYSDETGLRMLWSDGLSGFVQQALMLQPKWLVQREERRNETYFLRGISYSSDAISIPKELDNTRKSLLHSFRMRDNDYVLMSVYATEYDLERNPRFYESVRLLETVGDELAKGVDFLISRGIGVVLVGSDDTGRSNIPREFPRLSEFGVLGGPEEVALATRCRYFWTDNVGAWWLVAPFKRPVLHTNFHHKTPRHPTFGIDMYLPRLYKTPDGHILTLREMLYFEGSLNKAALRGELTLIRNSSEEVLEAHQEMLAWVNGEWLESRSTKLRRKRVEEIFSSFQTEDLHPLRMPAAFLERHEYLLS